MLRCLPLLALLAVAALVPTPVAAADRGAPLAEHVVLVDWDGFDPDYLGRVPTPNLDGLARAGAMALADSTYHTISNPARASMSTGAYPEAHGNAAYVFDPFTNRAQGQSRFLAAETIAASEKLGDLVAEARPPYGFTDETLPAGQQRGSHGSLTELKVPFYLAGAGIENGTRLRRSGLVDVAPTIAALLGARAPADAQGRPLSEAFGERP